MLKHTKRSMVCRLHSVATAGSGVIAKRCTRQEAELESFIYNDILGDLPMESLQCYGFVEGDGDYGWLFLEDGGTATGEGHESSFAHWLGILHVLISGRAKPIKLPDRGA